MSSFLCPRPAAIMTIGAMFFGLPAAAAPVENVLTPWKYNKTIAGCNKMPVYRPTGKGVLRTVTNDRQFNVALLSARPGDVISVKAGSYKGNKKIIGVNGTAKHPIVITSAKKHGAKISGGSFGFYAAQSSHYKIIGFNVEKAGIWGMVNGGGYPPGSFPGKVPPGAVHDVQIVHNKVHQILQEGVSVQGFKELASYNVEISCNEIFETGLKKRYGEGIYIGNGKRLDGSHDILIRNNHVHHTTAEAIDVKAGTYNITIEGNWIRDIVTDTTGAMVLGLGPYDFRSGNYLVKNNLIVNISRSTRWMDGNAIIVAHGNATIRDNIIANVQHGGVVVLQSKAWGFGNEKANTVSVINNHAYNCGNSCFAVVGRGGMSANIKFEGNVTNGPVKKWHR